MNLEIPGIDQPVPYLKTLPMRALYLIPAAVLFPIMFLLITMSWTPGFGKNAGVKRTICPSVYENPTVWFLTLPLRALFLPLAIPFVLLLGEWSFRR